MTGLTARMTPTKKEMQAHYIMKADKALFEAMRCWPHQEKKKSRLIQESKAWAKKADY